MRQVIFWCINEYWWFNCQTNRRTSRIAFQLARQAGVAPQQVLKDIAGSAETVAIFTKDGGKNLLEAAVAARQLGINIDSIAKSARGVLNFEESITKELEASSIDWYSIRFTKARQLSLSKDIAGFEEEIRRQIQQQGDFLPV